MTEPPTRIRAVLFDLGGTLVDERDFGGWAELARGVYLDLAPEAIGHAFSEVEAQLDAGPFDLDHERGVVEYWRRLLSLAAETDVPEATARRFVEARRASERERPLPLFSDVRRCLDQLVAERRRLAIVSNSTSEALVRRILDRAGILGYFERVLSSGTEGVRKPDPEIFHRAVSRLGLRPPEALYVGNLPRTDALGARGAGLHSVWLHRDGTGFGDDPPEITSLLEVPLVVRSLEGTPDGPGAPRP